MAFTVPAVAALQNSTPLGAWDVCATVLFLLLLLGEALADAQMLRFQTEKYRRRAAKVLEVKGFTPSLSQVQ